MMYVGLYTYIVMSLLDNGIFLLLLWRVSQRLTKTHAIASRPIWLLKYHEYRPCCTRPIIYILTLSVRGPTLDVRI